MSFAPLVLRWRLTRVASLARSAITDLVLTNADGTAVTLTPGHAGLRDALLALCDGADEKHLMHLVGAQRSAHLYYHLSGLVGCGALEANAVLFSSNPRPAAILSSKVRPPSSGRASRGAADRR